MVIVKLKLCSFETTCCSDKNCREKQYEEPFTFALTLRVQSVLAEKLEQQGLEAASHIVSTVKKKREINSDTQITLSLLSNLDSGFNLDWCYP